MQASTRFPWRLIVLTFVVLTLGLTASAHASLPYVWTAPTTIDAHALTGVACPSPSLCVAVDDSGDVITSTNPAAGVWIATGIPGIGTFSGVSCPSTSLCVAVDTAGDVVSSSDPTGGPGSWGVDHVSNSPLSAVSCPSVTMCIATVDAGLITSSAQARAAGTVLMSTSPQATGSWVAEHADPFLGFECGKYTEWGNCANAFTGLSCPTISLCVAADEYGYVVSSADPAAGVAATWGAQSAVGAGASGTSAVSCASASWCVGTCAVGFGYVSTQCPGNTYDLGDVVTWNPTASGSGANSSVNYATLATTQLSGVWCGSTSVCFAAQVGKLYVSSNPTGGASAWPVSYVDPDPSATIRAVACSTAFCVTVDSTGHAIVGSLVTAARIETQLGRQLVPTGKAARIGALIRHRSYTVRWAAATAGRLRISWYACRHCSPAAARRKVKIASGSRSYSGVTTLRVRLSLARSARRLLKRSRRLQITAVASFTPSGDSTITVTRPFRLRR